MKHNAYRIGKVLYEVDEEFGHVQSIYQDGACCTGVVQHDEESVARARSLGYVGTDREVATQMHLEHDLVHHLVMEALGWDSSVVLERAAHGSSTFPAGIYQLEERMAFLVQRAMNIGHELIEERGI